MKNNDSLISVPRSVNIKVYNPIVSIQGQNDGQQPSRPNTRLVQKSIFTTLLSQYKVKMKNNDPLVSVQGHFNLNFTTLVSVQGQNENNDPLVSVQGQFH